MKGRFVILYLVLCFWGCNSKVDNGNEIEGKLVSIQLSPNDTEFVFSYFNNGQGSIYTSNLNGKNVKLIAKSKGKETYSHPRYSSDGKKIIFLSFTEDRKQSSIFLTDKLGESIQQITDYTQLITEAVFTYDGKRIFYSKASEIKSYSPIAPTAPHKMDIFSIDIERKMNRQLTNLNAYSIQNLIATDSMIMFVESLEGPFYFNLNEPEKITAHQPKNVNELRIIGCGGFIWKNDSTYFLGGGAYHLYVMNNSSKEARLILDNNFQMENLGVFHYSDKIFFTKNIKGDNSVIIYDLKDQSLTEILIKV
jgi:hypothetical protein